MQEITYWDLNLDKENIRDGAIELRAKVAENFYHQIIQSPKDAQAFVSNGRNFWRRESLEKFKMFIGSDIHGRVAEIGAGVGWYSALLSKIERVEEVYALDYDEFSVKELIPKAVANLDGDPSKIKLTVGSYNKMQCPDNYFDFVFSVGAIHHSENLQDTFSECFRVLKPGGYLLALEHCHPNSYTNSARANDDNEMISVERAKMLYGDADLKIMAKDNSDHNYRLCEFQSASYQVGFDIFPYIFDVRGEAADDSIFTNPQPFENFGNRVFTPYYAKSSANPMYDNFTLIARKPDGNELPKSMRDLNVGYDRPKPSLTWKQRIKSMLPI